MCGMLTTLTDCDIVVDLDHVSRDMKFRRHDTFVISFIEENDEWTVQMLMADGRLNCCVCQCRRNELLV
jgi:hypothetical protein